MSEMTTAIGYDGYDDGALVDDGYDGYDGYDDEDLVDDEYDDEDLVGDGYDDGEFEAEDENLDGAGFWPGPVPGPRGPGGPGGGPDGPGPVEDEPVEVIGHVSDLLAAGERVRRSDLAPLQDLVGRQAARALQQCLQEDWQAARGARSSRAWWKRLGRLVPLPDSLAELVVRWQDGERLGRADLNLLAEVVGHDLARRLLPQVRSGWWRR